ncbi:hypothetical protein [Hazenella coriacea]|uniref:Uncharacterized protein n=1 Tax=Hazenella coriacea TaxID=1179467 RepID=A0A4R3LAT8_9BACL|nr:hypothetical protein [Hazenella coriacea]TCS96822.1 hypothetical protein EDD58_101464 [Hazenella coriacea]
MDEINDRYYKGFEGEPEIQFIYTLDNEKKSILKIWIGYFETIMDAMITGEGELTGLVYYYSLHEGWYDESPWQIPNSSEAIEHFSKVRIEDLEQEVQQTLGDVIKVLPEVIKEIVIHLTKARDLQEAVYISYE